MAEPPEKFDKQSRYTEGRGIAGAWEGETVTRRRLMEGTALAVGGVATMAFALPGSASRSAPSREDRARQLAGRGPDRRLQRHELCASGHKHQPRDRGRGKTTVYVRQFNRDIDKVIEGQDPQPYVVISTRCAHLGCPVRYIQASEKFLCPCHGGVYDSQGQVEGGPPVRPLDRFYTRVTNGRVEVGDRFSLNSELERFSPRDPSNHLDGLWQYLYPSRPTT